MTPIAAAQPPPYKPHHLMTPLCNFLTLLISVPRSRRGCLGCSRRRSIQRRATRYSSDYLHKSVTGCTSTAVCCIKSISDQLRLGCLYFLSQSYRDGQCLKSSNLCTRTPTAFLPLAQADPLAPVQGPLTLQLIMGLAPGPWVARKRRRMSAAEELRRGEKGRRLDKVKISWSTIDIFMWPLQIIQKIHTTMDFLPECQYLGVGRRS